MPASFSHEQTFRLTEQQYVAIHGLLHRKTRWLRYALAAMAGIACLFWIYTFILGVVLLAFLALSVFEPRVLKAGARSTYSESPHLHQELTYGASDEALWVRGQDLDLRTTWKNVRVWDERGDWLYVAPNGMTPLYFAVPALKETGHYDAMLALAAASAPRFNVRRRAV
jgi:hypothetical protein